MRIDHDVGRKTANRTTEFDTFRDTITIAPGIGAGSTSSTCDPMIGGRTGI